MNVMDLTDVVCARCDAPIPEGAAYSQQLLAAPDLVIVVCAPCGVKP